MFSSGFSEIVLMVEDVEESASFYRDVVGLSPNTEPTKEWAWFWAGSPGQSQRLALHKGSLLFEDQSPHPDGERWGHIHYAFRVTRDKLQEAVDHVKSFGIEVYGPRRFDWMKATSYYFYDPDGNMLEWWSPDQEAE